MTNKDLYLQNNLKVVAVDDEEFNLELIKEISTSIYPDMKTFSDPSSALEYITSNHVDILLVDYMMPNINGIMLMKKVHEIDPDILAIMITAAGDDEEIKLSALEEGAIDFLKKPINVLEYRARMKNVAKIKSSQLILDNFNSKLEEEVKKATATLYMREEEALEVLSNAVEYRDPETASHISRVAHYSKLLAREYGLNEREQDLVFKASPLHDIGKVGINDTILLKPGRLSDEEMKEMMRHSKIGWSILNDKENPYLQAGAIIAHTHHEKYDGSGYPNALKSTQIHIYGRITAIADVFDALTSIRPYKKAWDFNRAIEYLKEQSGTHFDPFLCELFIKNIDTVESIYNRFKY